MKSENSEVYLQFPFEIVILVKEPVSRKRPIAKVTSVRKLKKQKVCSDDDKKSDHQ